MQILIMVLPHRIWKLLLALLTIHIGMLCVIAQSQLRPAEIAARAKDATVQIRALNTRSQISGSGSGFIVAQDGVIVTNFHVIQGASSLQVELSSGEIYDNVYFITADPRRDLALIKIPAERLSSLKLGNDIDAEIGEKVYVMGNPLGMTNTFSDGIVSAKRIIEGVSMLQITAPISPGSSGGPVMNGAGDIIGIATMMLRGGQNLNYAVPVRYIRPLTTTGERPQRFNASLLPRPTGGLITATTTPEAPSQPALPRESTDDQWEAQVRRQLSRIDDVFSDNGLSRSHSIGTGTLRNQQSENLTIRLRAGSTYGIVGACDNDCTDLDLAVYSPNGSLLKRDVSDDDLPFIVFRAAVTGTYRIRVIMTSCSTPPCRYGVTAYVER